MTLFDVNKYVIVFFILLLSVGNAALDHFYAPKGIDYTPYLLTINVLLIVLNKQKFNLYLQMFIIYSCISVNDIGIKLYGGGLHDLEGQVWIFGFLLLGLIPTLTLLTIVTLRNKSYSLVNRIAALMFFVSLITIHYNIFQNLGLGRSYPIY